MENTAKRDKCVAQNIFKGNSIKISKQLNSIILGIYLSHENHLGPIRYWFPRRIWFRWFPWWIPWCDQNETLSSTFEDEGGFMISLKNRRLYIYSVKKKRFFGAIYIIATNLRAILHEIFVKFFYGTEKSRREFTVKAGEWLLHFRFRPLLESDLRFAQRRAMNCRLLGSSWIIISLLVYHGAYHIPRYNRTNLRRLRSCVLRLIVVQWIRDTQWYEYKSIAFHTCQLVRSIRVIDTVCCYINKII